VHEVVSKKESGIYKPAFSGGSMPEIIASFTRSSLRKCLKRIQQDRDYKTKWNADLEHTDSCRTQVDALFLPSYSTLAIVFAMHDEFEKGIDAGSSLKAVPFLAIRFGDRHIWR